MAETRSTAKNLTVLVPSSCMPPKLTAVREQKDESVSSSSSGYFCFICSLLFRNNKCSKTPDCNLTSAATTTYGVVIKFYCFLDVFFMYCCISTDQIFSDMDSCATGEGVTSSSGLRMIQMAYGKRSCPLSGLAASKGFSSLFHYYVVVLGCIVI